MESIVLRTEEDVIDFFKHLSPSLTNNPEFSSAVEYELSKYLSEGLKISAFYSDDGKEARVILDPKVIRDPNLPRSEMQALEVKLVGPNNDHMEVIKTFGRLYEANAYYRDRNTRPYYSCDSILDTFYSRALYDPEGIELQHSQYYKTGWGLTNVDYTNTREFRIQLLSDGYHKPAEWSYNGPKIPSYHIGAYVTGVVRQSNPALAEVFRYDIANGYNIRDRKTSLAYVHSEYPERLRIDEYNIFAKFVNGDYELYDPFKVYEGKTVDEVEREISLKYDESLDHSKTREYNHRMYEVLKERLAQANTQYTNQKTTNDEVKHM